jgi:hypothetical protein
MNVFWMRTGCGTLVAHLVGSAEYEQMADAVFVVWHYAVEAICECSSTCSVSAVQHSV